MYYMQIVWFRPRKFTAAIAGKPEKFDGPVPDKRRIGHILPDFFRINIKGNSEKWRKLQY